jgi:hypothetical protein
MADDYYNSPNGFMVRRYNETEKEPEIEIKGTTIFQDPDQYYPDYEMYQQEKLSEQQWQQETKESQEKLNELRKNVEEKSTVINQNDNEVEIDPNAFFNNNSQVYVLYNLGDKLKDK